MRKSRFECSRCGTKDAQTSFLTVYVSALFEPLLSLLQSFRKLRCIRVPLHRQMTCDQGACVSCGKCVSSSSTISSETVFLLPLCSFEGNIFSPEADDENVAMICCMRKILVVVCILEIIEGKYKYIV